MSNGSKTLNRRSFLRTLAAGTCGAACHGLIRPFNTIALADGVPGATKNFIEIFLYGGCCTYGMSPVHHVGAQAKYPTLYRTPAQATPIPGATLISLHAGFAPMVTEANRDKSSVALVMGTGHPTTYSRSHDVAQQANERLDYNSNLESGIGVGAAIAQAINHPMGLISFGGNTEFTVGGTIAARAIGSLATGRADMGHAEAYALTEQMIVSGDANPSAAQQYVASAITGMKANVAQLQQLASINPPANFPNTGIGNTLEDIARVISAKIGGGQCFFVPYGGFDTHSNQAGQHNTLFTNLGNALAQLVIALKATPGRVAARAWDETVIVTRTDFGRTWENNGQGSDHGEVYNQIVLGGLVVGGVIGAIPTEAEYQNAPRDYMGPEFVQFSAMQPTKEIITSMGLAGLINFPDYPGNRYVPLGIMSA